MPTYKTRLGPIALERVSLTEWQASATQLRVNGKECLLRPTKISLGRTGWSINAWLTLQRFDGGRTTVRAREKVEEVVKELIGKELGDNLPVERERWVLTLQDLGRDRDHFVRRVETIEGELRVAACQLKAHELPGAQGEVARVLVREGWERTPEELEETVQILTG